MEKQKQYPEWEKRWVFILLIFVAGFYGGYTLSVRGGVLQWADRKSGPAWHGTGQWKLDESYLLSDPY